MLYLLKPYVEINMRNFLEGNVVIYILYKYLLVNIMHVLATIWLKYCRRGVKHQSINQSNICSLNSWSCSSLIMCLKKLKGHWNQCTANYNCMQHGTRWWILALKYISWQLLHQFLSSLIFCCHAEHWGFFFVVWITLFTLNVYL